MNVQTINAIMFQSFSNFKLFIDIQFTYLFKNEIINRFDTHLLVFIKDYNHLYFYVCLEFFFLLMDEED